MRRFFVVLARVAERRVGDFNAQALGNTGRAYAKAEQLDAKTEQADTPLFVVLARVAVRRVGEFSRTGVGQHGVGACEGGAVGCAVAEDVGEGYGTARGRHQRTGAGQHGVGVCEGGAVGCAVVCGVGDGGFIFHARWLLCP